MSARLSLLVSLLISALGLAGTAHAQSYKEHDVKAAILYNIARYSEWAALDEDEQAGTFTVCFLKKDKLAQAMGNLTGRPIHDRTLAVEILASLDDTFVKPCRILFISQAEETKHDLGEIIKLGIVTAGESDRFLDRSGAISIRRYGDKMGFSINRSNMALANVTPSSRMLKLAQELR